MQDAVQKNKKQDFTKALGRVILKLKKTSKLSARAIAYEVGMSKTTLLLAERGNLDPQLTTFCKLAEAFYIKPDELLKMVLDELPKDWSFVEDNN